MIANWKPSAQSENRPQETPGNSWHGKDTWTSNDVNKDAKETLLVAGCGSAMFFNQIKSAVAVHNGTIDDEASVWMELLHDGSSTWNPCPKQD